MKETIKEARKKMNEAFKELVIEIRAFRKMVKIAQHERYLAEKAQDKALNEVIRLRGLIGEWSSRIPCYSGDSIMWMIIDSMRREAKKGVK